MMRVRCDPLFYNVLFCCKLAATECNYTDPTLLWKFHSSYFRRIFVIIGYALGLFLWGVIHSVFSASVGLNTLIVGIDIEPIPPRIADQRDTVAFRHFDGQGAGGGARDQNGRLEAGREASRQ